MKMPTLVDRSSRRAKSIVVDDLKIKILFLAELRLGPTIEDQLGPYFF